LSMWPHENHIIYQFTEEYFKKQIDTILLRILSTYHKMAQTACNYS
jgi:hypothetical protein